MADLYETSKGRQYEMVSTTKTKTKKMKREYKTNQVHFVVEENTLDNGGVTYEIYENRRCKILFNV